MKIEPIIIDGKKVGAKISDVPLINLIDKKPSIWDRIKSKLKSEPRSK